MGFVGMWCTDIICRDVVHRVPTIIRWRHVPTISIIRSVSTLIWRFIPIHHHDGVNVVGHNDE